MKLGKCVYSNFIKRICLEKHRMVLKEVKCMYIVLVLGIARIIYMSTMFVKRELKLLARSSKNVGMSSMNVGMADDEGS